MDRNFVLACALSLAVLVGWIYLTGGPDQARRSGENSPTHTAQSDPFADAQAPAESRAEAGRGAAADAGPASPAGGVPSAEDASRPASARPPVAERQIRFETPLYTVEFTSRGAGISSWKLANFGETSDPAAPRIELATGAGAGRPLFATPFSELGIGDLSDRVFEVVDEGAASVSFETRESGISVRKTYTLEPDTYSFRLLVEVENESTGEVAPRFQIDIPARRYDANDFREQALAALEDGSRVAVPVAALGSGGFFQSITGRKPELHQDFPGEIDWAGIQTTYFLTAIAPDSPSQASVRIATLEPRELGATQLWFAETALPAGRSMARELRGYMGPKEMDLLEAFGGDTVHAVDLGWSWVEPLTRFFSLFLKMLHSVVPNYGIAIIILTILVRIVTAPLTIKQMRSMERMRALAPQLKQIKEDFPDDRQKQSEKTMALYKSEGVNPLSGCLPMLLQFPVFIGLFYALRSTIHLRQAPFVGWIDDLSVPEALFEIPGLSLPIRVLPLVMGATMVLQQRITPMQADPAQAKMMMIVMPIMMTVIFYQFPSGLVLYWMVSNVLAISHQLWIGRGLRAKTES